MFFESIIMNCMKVDQLCNIFIRNLCVYISMSEVVWKCYRCNLSFKDEGVAEIHKQISSHSVSKV